MLSVECLLLSVESSMFRVWGWELHLGRPFDSECGDEGRDHLTSRRHSVLSVRGLESKGQSQGLESKVTQLCDEQGRQISGYMEKGIQTPIAQGRST